MKHSDILDYSPAPPLGAGVASSVVVAESPPLSALLSPPETHFHRFSF